MNLRRKILALTISSAALIAIGLSLGSPAEARAVPRWYCSTTTTVGQACIPDPTTTVKPTTTTHYATTTQATTTTAASTTIATTTTAATTTVPETTTTIGLGFCTPAPGVLCVNIDQPTTTVPPTTTTVGATTTTAAPPTTIPDTTAVDQTLPPSATTSVGQELPHTGTNYSAELAVGFGLLFAGWACYALRAATRRS